MFVFLRRLRYTLVKRRHRIHSFTLQSYLPCKDGKKITDLMKHVKPWPIRIFWIRSFYFAFKFKVPRYVKHQNEMSYYQIRPTLCKREHESGRETFRFMTNSKRSLFSKRGLNSRGICRFCALRVMSQFDLSSGFRSQLFKFCFLDSKFYSLNFGFLSLNSRLQRLVPNFKDNRKSYFELTYMRGL